MSDSCDPMDYTVPGSSVNGISQADYWSGLSFLSAGDLPDSSIKPEFPALQVVSCISGRFFTTEPPGKPWIFLLLITKSVLINLGINISDFSLVANVTRTLLQRWKREAIFNLYKIS